MEKKVFGSEMWKAVEVGDVVFVNATPHKIKIWKDGHVVMAIPSCGTVLRVLPRQSVVAEVAGVPVVKTEFEDKVAGFEKLVSEAKKEFENKKIVVITSTLVAQAVSSFEDERVMVVAPDMRPFGAVRDESGKIVAVKGFQIF